MDSTPSFQAAERCTCGYLKVQMGSEHVHIAPVDEPDARSRITTAHNDLGRFAPPPNPRATSAYPQR